MFSIIYTKSLNRHIIHRFIIITIISLLQSCDDSTNKQSNTAQSIEKIAPTNNATQDLDKQVKQVLSEQILAGESALYNHSFDIERYKYTEKDLLAIIPILESKLGNYKKPSQNEFSILINQIFGEKINFFKKPRYIYINLDDKSDRTTVFRRNDNSIEIHPPSIFILKDARFITQLYAIPEILDYRALFPGIANLEDNMSTDVTDTDGTPIKIYRWRDSENTNPDINIKTLIARNKYLFNDDKSQLNWLLENDESFMHALIDTFNFSKDQQHRDWYNQKLREKRK